MSNDIYDTLFSLDPLLRHPTRFAIMTLLLVSGPQTEGEISKKLKIPWGPLSTHIKRLVQAGYIEVKKYPTLKGPRTYVIPTTRGIKAYHNHIACLEEIIDKTKRGLHDDKERMK